MVVGTLQGDNGEVLFCPNFFCGGALQERRRRRAENRLSKKVFLESPFLLCSLKVFSILRANLKGAEKKRTFQKHHLDNRFSARRLLRSFCAL